MLLLALKLTLAPGLVAATTLAGRRWGPRTAGWLGGLPVVVGPILVALAIDHGDAFAATAAAGALLGLLSLTGFVLAYAWSARSMPWWAALGAGWAAFAAATVALEGVALAPLAALAVVTAVFAATEWALPRGRGSCAEPRTPRHDLLVRTASTAALVVLLTGLAEVLGARLSGMLAAFPVLASVLSAFTHAQAGADDVAAFLRGLVRGLLSFALFCFVVAVLLPTAGLAPAFAAATAAAVGAHALGHLAAPPGSRPERRHAPVP